MTHVVAPVALFASLAAQPGCIDGCWSTSSRHEVTSVRFDSWKRGAPCGLSSMDARPSAEKCPTPAEFTAYLNQCASDTFGHDYERATFVRYDGGTDECVFEVNYETCSR